MNEKTNHIEGEVIEEFTLKGNLSDWSCTNQDGAIVSELGQWLVSNYTMLEEYGITDVEFDNMSGIEGEALVGIDDFGNTIEIDDEKLRVAYVDANLDSLDEETQDYTIKLVVTYADNFDKKVEIIKAINEQDFEIVWQCGEGDNLISFSYNKELELCKVTQPNIEDVYFTNFNDFTNFEFENIEVKYI